MNNDPFDAMTQQLQEAIDEAKCTLDEMNESGDLEDRLEAAFDLEDAERRLSSHLLTDQQEDNEPS